MHFRTCNYFVSSVASILFLLGEFTLLVYSKDGDTTPLNVTSPKYYPDDPYERNEQGFIKQGMASPYTFSLNQTPDGSPEDPVRKWTIAAEDDCMPQISCPVFSIASSDWAGVCEDQWLEVSDGVAGMKRFCGRKGPKNVVVAQQEGLRDLYVTFRNNERMSPFKAKFECSVTCGTKETANFLPKVLKEKVDEGCLCGQKPPRNRIIGGHDTYFSEFPWMAAMVVASTRQPFCIGSVINDRMILTAAHCFKGKFRKAKNTQIVLNGYTMDPMPNINILKNITVIYREYDDATLKKLDSGNGSFRFNVERIWLHPLYVSDTSDFDTAVMILSKPIDRKLFKTYSPICLPELNYDIDLYTGKKAAIAGWGLPSVTALGTNTEMKQITVTIFKPAVCQRKFGNRMVSINRQLCAAYSDSSEDSCAGDSGGPLVLQYRPQVWYQIGIISWGDGCALEGHPGIYYRTTSTNQWIRHMSNSKDAVWCDVPD